MEKGILPILIIGFIILLILVVGILFLIIYGLRKNKKWYWISGCIIATLCILLYLYFYTSRSKQINSETETIQRYEKELNENASQ